MMNARAFGVCSALALVAVAVLPALARADFGIKSFSVGAVEQNGTVDTLAGSHPHKLKVAFEMNQDEEGRPEGTLRDVIVELPPGLLGNPQATPRCTGAQFEGESGSCPGNTQVGVARVRIFNAGEDLIATHAIYNLVPPLGVPAAVGFTVSGALSVQEASLRTGSDYGANVHDTTIPTSVLIRGVTEEIWGVPADDSHDAERECLDPITETFFVPCEVETTPAPFLSLPTSCSGPLKFRILADSLQEPNVFKDATAVTEDEHGQPVGLNGCSAPPFKPTIEARPETSVADSPTGLHVDLNVPQNEGPDQLATAHLKDAVIALPPGLSVNPSSADGLAACGAAQIDLHGPGPAHCPDASKLGKVEVRTPLLDHPVNGAVYLAKQGENPFGSLIAIYVAVNDPQTGVVVKLAGKVEPNPLTGQLVTTFKENPQLPFEDFEVDFFGGPRAALTTPATCGTYTTTTDLTPWTSPEGPDAFPSSSFTVNGAAGGGSCASSEAQMPNKPSFQAGTIGAPLAAAYSPFGLRLNRENGSQRFGAVDVTLPPGVSAKLAGVKECSEAQIVAARARSNPGEGALELASPSCPAASEVGIVNVGTGSGSPLYVQGRAYLAGPYKDAPLSLAIVTPAVAGPFDLGVVVVRSALYVDETTAQATVRSDPLPTILQGIPLDVRSIAVKIDRPRFSLNPTSCEEMAISGAAISTTGQAASLKDRFKVLGCRKLDFSPKLSLRLKGATRRSGHPTLRAVLKQPKDQANIARTTVILPPTQFIDQGHIANPCTRTQFDEHRCPPSSVLGRARAFTPLLDKPLEGPLYFRSNGGERELPDLVADLHGRIHIVLVGFVDAVHRKGSESSRVRTTFARVPDAPVTKAVFSLKGGRKGLLVNSANLCKVPQVVTVKMRGHNGKVRDANQRIATGCRRK
jgi:hypothetical protein